MSAIGTSCSQFVCSGPITNDAACSTCSFLHDDELGRKLETFHRLVVGCSRTPCQRLQLRTAGSSLPRHGRASHPRGCQCSNQWYCQSLLVAGWCPARALWSLIHVGGICILPMAASHAPSSPTSLARSWRYSAFLSALLNSGGAAANIEWASSP